MAVSEAVADQPPQARGGDVDAQIWLITRSWHGDCQPSRQATRGGAIAAVIASPPWRPGRTAPLSFGGVLVTATDRRKLSARAG
jgi:hypothetical protein